MVRSLLTGLALAGLAAASPAAARKYSDQADSVAGWDLTATPKTCSMASTFADNVTLALVWAPSTGELGFMAAVPQPSALGAQKAAALALAFDGDGPITQWEQTNAPVIDGEDNVAVMGNWGREHSEELARTVAAAEHVRVRVGDRDVGTYDLSGNQAAYKALMRCGERIAAK
jgi:hypothetical protein